MVLKKIAKQGIIVFVLLILALVVSGCIPEDNVVLDDDGFYEYEAGLSDAEDNEGVDELSGKTELQIAEERLQEKVCSIMPTTATNLTHLSFVRTAVFVPKELNKMVKLFGAEYEGFGRYVNSADNFISPRISGTNNESYQDAYYLCPHVEIEHNRPGPCVILMSVNLTDSEGNILAERTGAIIVDIDLSGNITNCRVAYDEKCEQKPGQVFCWQCEFKSILSHFDMHDFQNLGKCFYCPSGTTCTAGGHCSGPACRGGGGGGGTRYYYVTCCSVQYSGTSRDWCNYYKNLCYRVEPNCPHKEMMC